MKYALHSILILLVVASANPLSAEEGEFDSNGVKIHYVTEGTGEPVVLIHGWMGDSTTWGKDANGKTKLNTKGVEGFLLIAIDCRGHGQSEKPHDPAKYGPELATDVVRLLDHLKLKKAHLIGYSAGAYIAGKVAATHPDRVLSLVYGGQAPVIEGGKASDFSECDLFARAVEEGKGLGSYIIGVTPAGRPKLTPEQANGYAKFLYDGKDVKAFAAAGLSFKNLAVTGEQLRKCPAPVLFIHGGNESDHVKGKVALVHKLLEGSTVKVIDGADHMSTLTKPEFGKALLEFLKANRQK